MKIEPGRCNNCGKKNAECVKYPLLWIFNYSVCQSCISKSFRSFCKDK